MRDVRAHRREGEVLEDEPAQQPRRGLERQHRNAGQRHERDEAQPRGGHDRHGRGQHHQPEHDGEDRDHAPAARAEQRRHTGDRGSHTAVVGRHDDLHEDVDEVDRGDPDDEPMEQAAAATGQTRGPRAVAHALVDAVDDGEVDGPGHRVPGDQHQPQSQVSRRRAGCSRP